jgi:tryptophan synthase beta chain
MPQAKSRRDPDARGYFGEFGGRFVPETLMEPVEDLERAYLLARDDVTFCDRLDRLLAQYAGRPTPVYEATRLSEACGGARIFLKREDLTHTGAHKINNALGQALLAQRMGKRRIVAETGAGQHGVATATACALLGLDCRVYMGTEDMHRQSLNVFRMRLLGAEVCPVDAGSRTLKDAINEAMRDWVAHVVDTYYLLGSALGPHPYPLMVREFQSVIGREARPQFLDQTGTLPSAVVACVGGGSNAIGIFDAFIEDRDVQLIGVEAGGEGISRGRHAARFAAGRTGVLQGTRSFVLQDDSGNIDPTHSISAGLDYAAVGPEHAWLRASGRTRYVHVSDADAIEAFQMLARLEGLLPALESAHAVAYARTLASALGAGGTILVNLSGRGDKDVETMAKYLPGVPLAPGPTPGGVNAEAR